MNNVQVPAGRYLPGPNDSPLWEANATALPVYQTTSGVAWFALAAHGDPAGIRVGDQTFTATELAAWLRELPDWSSRPIILITCDAATPTPGGVSLAEQLRDELRVQVVAAPATVWS
ncbi:hypothetical protein, partial [Micromonospora echinofusca]